MNKAICTFGLILLIIGIGASAYTEKNFLYSEPRLEHRAVPPEDVESMQAEGWEEIGIIPHKVLMTKEGVDSYWLFPLDEVESMKEKGFVGILTFEEYVSDVTRWKGPVTSEELASVKKNWDDHNASEGDVLMVKEGWQSYYDTTHPYGLFGSIIALMGFVTAIIGVLIRNAVFKHDIGDKQSLIRCLSL